MDASERAVWVFLGEGRRWPGGVFSSREAAERWVGEHALTGMITKYPLDAGVYDWAVGSGAFRPTQPKHSSAEFIGGFTTAAQDHGHYTDGVQD